MINTPTKYRLYNTKTKHAYVGQLSTPIEIGRTVIVQFHDNYEYRVAKVQRVLKHNSRYYLVDVKGIVFHLEEIPV